MRFQMFRLLVVTALLSLAACGGDGAKRSTDETPDSEAGNSSYDSPDDLADPDGDDPVNPNEPDSPDPADPGDEDDPAQPEPPEIAAFFADPNPSPATVPLDFQWEIDSEAPVACSIDADADGTPEYEFEDCLGTTSATHVYTEPRMYGARLTVTGDFGEIEKRVEVEVGEAPAVVTSTSDAGPGTLREAVEEAAPGETITFDLPPESTITLASQIFINSDVTICGAGARETILSGGSQHRIFRIMEGTTVTLCDLTIENGLSELIDTSYDTKKAEEGGAIRAEGTDDEPIDLTLRNVVVRDSQAYTEEPNRTFDSGGCLFFDTGKLRIESSTFENCFASSGGAVTAFGEVEILDSVFTNNESLNPGGALQILGAADIRGSSFVGNRAGTGGGAMIIELRAEKAPGPRGDGSSVIVNSSFSDNETPAGGGAIFSYTTLTMINSTVWANVADDPGEEDDPQTVTYGGGIYQHDDTSQDDYTLTLRNSIVFGNVSAEGPDIKGEFVAKGTNLIGDLSDASIDVPANANVSNPQVAGLTNQNGAPPVVELNDSSPAIDAVPTGECLDWDGSALTIDQRGEPRPAGAACDIGAFEKQ